MESFIMSGNWIRERASLGDKHNRFCRKNRELLSVKRGNSQNREKDKIEIITPINNKYKVQFIEK
jgi:hypothetical protein